MAQIHISRINRQTFPQDAHLDEDHQDVQGLVGLWLPTRSSAQNSIALRNLVGRQGQAINGFRGGQPFNTMPPGADKAPFHGVMPYRDMPSSPRGANTEQVFDYQSSRLAMFCSYEAIGLPIYFMCAYDINDTPYNMWVGSFGTNEVRLLRSDPGQENYPIFGPSIMGKTTWAFSNVPGANGAISYVNGANERISVGLGAGNQKNENVPTVFGCRLSGGMPDAGWTGKYYAIGLWLETFPPPHRLQHYSRGGWTDLIWTRRKTIFVPTGPPPPPPVGGVFVGSTQIPDIRTDGAVSKVYVGTNQVWPVKSS